MKRLITSSNSFFEKPLLRDTRPSFNARSFRSPRRKGLRCSKSLRNCTRKPGAVVPETAVPETAVPDAAIPETDFSETDFSEFVTPESVLFGSVTSEIAPPETVLPESVASEIIPLETAPPASAAVSEIVPVSGAVSSPHCILKVSASGL